MPLPGVRSRMREDVPDQVVVVAKVLQGLAARVVAEIVRFGVALAAQALQAKGVRVVGIAGHHAVAVGDERALALGVVGDALDIEGVVQEDLFQPAGAVVDRAQLAALAFHVLRELQALDAVQGIDARGGPVGRRPPAARLRGRRGSAAAAAPNRPGRA